MNWSVWIRQSHRWLSIVFTLTVVANFVYKAAGSGEPPSWLTYSPLPPLFLQLFSGSQSLLEPSKYRLAQTGHAHKSHSIGSQPSTVMAMRPNQVVPGSLSCTTVVLSWPVSSHVIWPALFSTG